MAAWASAFAASCVLAAAYWMLPPRPPLDAGFPAEPTAAELAVLRRAYARAPVTWPKPRLLPGARFTEMQPLQIAALPEGKDRDLARLGEKLFNDPVLSASGDVACQSCHNRKLGWGDGLPTSFGHGRAAGTRNAKSLFSAGYRSALFWDGRSASLEEQALGPLTDHREMANTDVAQMVQRLNAADHYRAGFAAATGDGQVTLAGVTSALAAFQRTLERQTRFDRFMQGRTKTLTDTEIWGLHLFRTKAGCANCHNGPMLSDNRLHNLGLSYFNRKLEDLGRFAVTGDPQDAGRFLTPSLRHVRQTAPYMHNGVFPSLAGLIRFYEAGGGRIGARGQDVPADRRPLLDAAAKTAPLLKPFRLTPAERAALLAFLEAL